ncbi:T9SS type A sorting domain-containing protein [bacterium BMS3Abin03]|nr:T9SS type A sorting domain-containing protein [bacterium BMS3Abin03]
MKKIMYSLFFLVCFLLSSTLSAQVLNFNENFDYPAGDSLNTHGWVPHSQPGVNPVMVVSGSLTYSGYTSSGIGNSAHVIGSASLVSLEDLTATFNIDSVSNVYCSFLAQVASVGAQVDYFFHFRENPVPSILRGRVMLSANGGGFRFGISKGSTSNITWDTTTRNFGETYLIVLKYEYVAGDNNDLIHLFVNPSLGGGEPSTPDATIPDTTGSDIIVNAVSLRQGSRDYDVIVDGIRVSTSWNEAPLPVELSSFTAKANGDAVTLNWSTASELNNAGFEIQRKSVHGEFIPIGYKKGAGTTSERNVYSYTDSKLDAGNYTYRLKQIDYDGSFAYSKEVEADISKPINFSLAQNYPNPFNPSTKIDFSIPVDSKVMLKVYNVLGEEVTSLLNSNISAGNYSIDFNASNLNSGVYFYRLEASGIDGYHFSTIRKMILTK